MFVRELSLMRRMRMDGGVCVVILTAGYDYHFCFLSLGFLCFLLFLTMYHRALGGLTISGGIMSVESEVKPRFRLVSDD